MYAELGTFITESGGEWPYLKAAFGPIPAYLYSWMSIMLMRPSSVSIISLTCAEYILGPAFEDGCGPAPAMYNKLTAIAIIRM